MKQKFDITGMTCSACSAHVDKSVRSLNGVNDVNVNLLKNSKIDFINIEPAYVLTTEPSYVIPNSENKKIT